jgi:tripartite ATP-independent transporter DctP family solute receptor
MAVVVFLLVGIQSALFAGGDQESLTKEKQIVLRVANIHAASQPYSLALEKWVELFELETGGQVKGNVFPGGAIVTSQQDSYAQVKTGSVDATISVTVENDVPALQIISFPYAFTSYDQWRSFMDGEEMKELEQEFLDKTGIRIIGKSFLGSRHISANKKVLSPSDLRGIRLRAIESPLYIDMIESWGARATPVAFPELLQALSTGIVDGQENPIPSIYQNRFFEAQDYLMLTSHLVGGDYWMMNEETFQSLSPENQEVLLKTAYEATIYGDQLILEQEQDLRAVLEENGMTVIGAEDGLDVDSFVEMTRNNMWPKYRPIIGADIMDAVENL